MVLETLGDIFDKSRRAPAFLTVVPDAKLTPSSHYKMMRPFRSKDNNSLLFISISSEKGGGWFTMIENMTFTLYSNHKVNSWYAITLKQAGSFIGGISSEHMAQSILLKIVQPLTVSACQVNSFSFTFAYRITIMVCIMIQSIAIILGRCYAGNSPI